MTYRNYTLRKSKRFSVMAVVAWFLFNSSGMAQEVNQVFPLWKEGFLDIHHINTGKGDAAFFILPDGTTMLVDAGEHTRPPGPRELKTKPNDSRSPGEWISRYILNMLNGQPKSRIDYVLVTHFDSDHMGGYHPAMKDSKNGNYKLSGITDVGDRISFDKVIDRAWPDYNWPRALTQSNIENYRKFLSWQSENNGVTVEQFLPGRSDQITLVNNPDAYPNFEVRNIVANGVVWTGVGNNTRNHFPLLENLDEKDFPSENMSSLAIRLSYGSFDYYTGGDLVGIPPAGSPEWQNIERPVANAVGPVDVHVLNHHGYIDAGNEHFIRTLSPRIHIIQSWVVAHPAPSTLSRMLSSRLYPGPRDVFSTNITETGKNFIGSASDKIKGPGHIVIRVDPKGENYTIFILEDTAENFIVKEKHGPYKSN